MKRIIVALLLLAVLILSGCKGGVTGGAVVCNKPYILVGTDCCLDKNDNNICDADEVETFNADPVEEPKEIIEEPVEEPEEVIEEPVEEPKEELPTNEFIIKLGESVKVDGKTITLVNLDNIPRLKAVFDVDGSERDVFGTKNAEIIKELKIMLLKYNNLENSVVAKIEKIELGLNEYLMNPRADVTIAGKTVHLYDVQDSGAIIIHIFGDDFENPNLRITEGQTETFEGLEITNIEGFPQGFKIDKYAIVKIEA